jgi:maltose alpha-D-glucosyltransferase/alpha-amylase
MGVVQEALPVEGDGWEYALEKVEQFYDRVEDLPLPEDPEDEAELPGWLEDTASEMIGLVRTLGVRTGELHLALGEAEGELGPREGSPDDIDALVDRVKREAEKTREMLQAYDGDPGDLPSDDDWERAFQHLDALRQSEATRQKIRIHGDYHLGQVLRADGEFYILDFEGEPARTVDERRQHDYALRDVAGMLRSFGYAAYAPLADGDGSREPWAARLVRQCERTFLDAYLRTAEEADFLLPKGARRPFLWAYLLDKALYEVRYELNHRPSWTWIPLRSLGRLLREPADTAHLEPAP